MKIAALPFVLLSFLIAASPLADRSGVTATTGARLDRTVSQGTRAEAAAAIATARASPRRTRKPAPSSVAAPGLGSLRRNQLLRIGLTANRERITISSSGRFRVVEPGTGQALWKDSYKKPLMVGIRGARPTEGRTYRVQVGSFENRDAAEGLAARLRGELGEPVVVVWVPDRRAWRIRAGEGDSREALAGVLSRLRAAGYEQIWIADEPVAQTSVAKMILLDEEFHVHPVERKLFAIEPASSEAFLSVDGRPYRGSLEVRLDSSGGLRVVNVVPAESYLRGVVPAELGPAVYPELEALKAQAIAARTYVYRNLGQFAEEGFDLCDTPRCQVYDGAKAEHPLSDRAIAETEGEIAVYHGEPINALYTSTCGGHTEDASEIFPESAAPYLVGVACAPEEGSWKSRRILVVGGDALAEAPALDAEAAALLAVHGLLPAATAEAMEKNWIEEPISGAEALLWIDAIGAACGVIETRAGGTAPDAAKGGPSDPSIALLARRLVDRLGWASRIDLLVAREDARSWFPDEEGALGDEEAGAVAYFLRQKGWPEGSNGGPDPDRRASRGDLARLLLFVARSCDLLSLREGIVRGGDAAGLKLSGKSAATHAVDAKALLFADYGAGPVPVRRLGLVTGDKIRYHVGAGDRIDELLLLPGRQGFSDDRFSSVSSWEVAYSNEDLAKRLDEFIGSGSLIDVIPVRRGVSGRVTEIKVVGSAGEARIKGFEIRTALGLKENLFTLDRQRDRSGRLHRVVFTGRGWGHGVGMCQIGAYGMALRGVSYRAILAHYYSGIALERLP